MTIEEFSGLVEAMRLAQKKAEKLRLYTIEQRVAKEEAAGLERQVDQAIKQRHERKEAEQRAEMERHQQKLWEE